MMKYASAEYETMVMKTDEVDLMLECSLANGATPEDAVQDVEMIDVLLQAHRMASITIAATRKTTAGHYRKGSDFHTTMSKIIEGRADGEFE